MIIIAHPEPSAQGELKQCFMVMPGRGSAHPTGRLSMLNLQRTLKLNKQITTARKMHDQVVSLFIYLL